MLAQQTFNWKGQTWQACFDWSAILFFEQRSGMGLPAFFAGLQTPGGERVGAMAVFIEAMLQRHHAGVSFDTCGEMAMDRALFQSLIGAAAGGLPQDGAEEGATGGNAASGMAG